MAYDRYVRQVVELNRSSRIPARAAVYKACFSAELLASMVVMRLFEGAETVDDVMDDHVKSWVKCRSRCSVDATRGHVKGAINKAKFKLSKTDPEGSVLNVLAEMMTGLRRYRLAHVISDATKDVIMQILPKLEPRQLREEMQAVYDYWPKDKKSDFYHFMEQVQKTAVEFAKFSNKLDYSEVPFDAKGQAKPGSSAGKSWKRQPVSKGRSGTSGCNARTDGGQRESGEDGKARK